MSPPPVAPPRLLRRSNDDRIIGGVCGGLARYWNIDPIILRVAFAVSILVGAFGLFVYLGLWLLVPDQNAPAYERYNPFWLRRITAVLLFLAAGGVLLGVMFGGNEIGVLVAALMAGAGVWIVMSQRQQRPSAVEMTDEQQTAPMAVGYAYGGPAPTQQLPQQYPPVAPRQRSYLGLIGLLAAMVASGVAVLLGAGATGVFAAALLALGVTLIIGGFMGRTKWLLLFAVPLLMLVSVVSQVERSDYSMGSSTWRPTAQNATYGVALGNVVVDFADWSGAPKPGDRVDLEVGAGTVTIELPRNWEARLVTQVGAGSVNVDGERVAQMGTTRIPAGSGRADGKIVITADVGAGDVLVTTDAPAVGAPADQEKPVENKKQKKETKA